MSPGSAGVRSVTPIQTSVVTPVVHNVVFAKMTGSEPLKGCARPANAVHNQLECSASVVARAAVIAEISLQAFTRHQYQRSKYTPPVPAPNSSTIFHPAPTEPSCNATSAAAITRKTVASRDTLT